MQQLIPTAHGQQRMSQRGIKAEDIDFAIRYGRAHYSHEAKVVFLGRRDIPKDLQRTHGHLEGTTLVLNPETGVLITCYRNKEALGAFRRDKKSASKRYGKAA